MLRNYFRKTFAKAVREEDGITAVEYAVMGALIAVALIAAVGTLTSGISTAFEHISTIVTTPGVGGGGTPPG
jgi:pilus assembly protein Flp/PilA